MSHTLPITDLYVS